MTFIYTFVIIVFLCDTITARCFLKITAFIFRIELNIAHNDIIRFVAASRHRNIAMFGFSNVHGDAYSWVRETDEIHKHQTPTNSNDSRVFNLQSPILK